MGNCAGGQSSGHDGVNFFGKSPPSEVFDPSETVLSRARDGVDEKLDDLIAHISVCLKKIKGLPWSEAGSSLGKLRLLETSDLGKLKQFLSDSTKAASSLKKVMASDNENRLKNAANTVLAKIRKSHWIAASLVVVAMLLEGVESIEKNKKECVDLMDEMYRLGKYLKNLKSKNSFTIQYMTSKLEESVRYAIQGGILCFSQMRTSWLYKSIGESMPKERIIDLHTEVERFHSYWLRHDGILLSRHKLYPGDAIAIEKSVNTVIELLELDSDKSVVAAVLWGFGGIGKSTIAEAVYAAIDTDEYIFCKVVLFDHADRKPSLTKVQKSLLDQLAEPNQEWAEPSSPTEGQMALHRRFRQVACFVFIDNVLEMGELWKLMPRQLSQSRKLRILITARNMNAREGLDIHNPRDAKLFEVAPLNREISVALLQKELGSCVDEISKADFEFFLKIAGGVPLLLEMIGRYIRLEHDRRRACCVIRDEYERDHSEGISIGTRSVDLFSFPFNNLYESYQESFLDICAFFYRWPWSVVQRFLGEDTMEILKRCCLIKRVREEHDGVSINCEECSVVHVHDVMLEIGRKRAKAKSDRITSAQQFTRLLHCYPLKDLLRVVKGVCLQDGINGEPVKIAAEKIDMMAPSLRILSTRFLQIEGKCTERFRKLIFLESVEPEPVINLDNLQEMRYLGHAPTQSLPTQSLILTKVPQAIRVVNLDLSTVTQPRLPRFLPDSVQSITISGSSELPQIPQQLLPTMDSLVELRLFKWPHLVELPGRLPFLSKLKGVWIHNCKNFIRLPKDFEEKCTALRVLSLRECEMLKQLPENIHNLCNLEVVHATGSKVLTQLPLKFSELAALRYLDLSSSENLTQLCDGFSALSSLEILDLTDCRALEPKWIDELITVKSLKVVYIKDCPQLIQKWGKLENKRTDIKINY